MTNHQLINQDSGNTSWYTPKYIIELARLTMNGVIDLDPASCEKANEVVKAQWYYDLLDDGLQYDWHGNVWMNHPFSRQDNKLWINKLVSEYECGNIKQACCITYASISAEWFRPLKNCTMCLPNKRVQYVNPNGKQITNNTKDSIITYLGKDNSLFNRYFSQIGSIHVPYKE